MGNLKSNQALIYESADGVTYARYRDPPYNTVPRWEVGRKANCTFLGYPDFKRMQEIAQTHNGFKDAWETMLTQYYLLKDIDTNNNKH